MSMKLFYEIVGAVAVLAVSVWALIFAFCWIRDFIDHRKEAKQQPLQWMLPGTISELGRWCGWYFPILEDVEKYLLKSMTHGSNISQFRDELWAKYGKRVAASDPESTGYTTD